MLTVRQKVHHRARRSLPHVTYTEKRKGEFWAKSEIVWKWWKMIAAASKVNRYAHMKVAERGDE